MLLEKGKNNASKATSDSIDFYQVTYPEDACIIVVDPVAKYRGTTTEKSLSLGKFMREERGSEDFRMAYIVSAQPIFDGEKVIGVLSAIISNEKMDGMRLLATELSSSVEEITATNEELAVASVDVSNRLVELSKFSESMTGDIQQINTIVNLVKDLL
ncbi:hypothetical protein [Lysinibacillus sp. NPDC093692]|uniref:hypothetical protein n=1 Tax=Lysinibacillus sp. NPDC093692 TaxID=3390578 RepID=UPI003D05B49E